MKRRTLITTGLVGSSTILAGCSGDPSGIISEDSEPEQTGSDESVDGDQANNGDSEEENQSTNNIFESAIETTIEGTGQSLREISIENSGIVLISVDTNSDIVISILDSNEEEVDSIDVEESEPFNKTVAELPPDDYAADIQTQGDWSITVEQYPVVSENDVDTEFPLEIEGNTENVFGPHVLSGFYRPVVQTNGSMAVYFYDENGIIIDSSIVFRASRDYDESPVEIDPINIDSVCWMICNVAPVRYRDEEYEVYYNLRLEEPE